MRRVEIPRVRELTPAAFARDFVDRRRPVVIEGVARDWPASSRWSHASFAARFGDRQVVAHRLRRHRHENLRLGLSEYLDRVGRGEPWYVGNFAFGAALPEARAEVDIPPLVPPTRRRPPCLWLAAAGHLTGTHFDIGHGLLTQVYGTKRVSIVALSDTWRFPRPSIFGDDWYTSPISLERGDHPALAGATIHDAQIGPGDAIFLPGLSHHEVRSLDESASVLFSWYPLRQWLIRRSLRLFGRDFT